MFVCICVPVLMTKTRATNTYTNARFFCFFLVHTNDKDTPIFNTLTLADGHNNKHGGNNNGSQPSNNAAIRMGAHSQASVASAK